jgi:diadenosine tetraphosphate (Ap4A) HIT family hydrolase
MKDDPVASPCPFCEPLAGRVILERKHIRILWDGYPLSAGHALVVPKRHIAHWREATPQERRALTRGIALAQEEIERQHTPDGYNIGLNDGAAAGQTVPHLHMHVIPRYAGDVADPRGGVRWVIPSRADYWSEPER